MSTFIEPADPATRRPAVRRRRSWRRVLLADVDADPALVEALWCDADALLAGGRMIKDGDRCTLAQIASSSRSLTLKRFNRRGPIHSLLHLPLRSRARWCWVNADRVMQAGARTPRPVAMLEWRIGPLRDRSMFVCESIDGRSLLEVVTDPTTTADRIDRLAEAFGRIWRQLGAARLGHRDMKASNFIVNEDDQIWLIDLDAMRRSVSGPMFVRRRRKDYARFMKNWRDHPDAAAAFRARIDTGAPPASAP